MPLAVATALITKEVDVCDAMRALAGMPVPVTNMPSTIPVVLGQVTVALAGPGVGPTVVQLAMTSGAE